MINGGFDPILYIKEDIPREVIFYMSLERQEGIKKWKDYSK